MLSKKLKQLKAKHFSTWGQADVNLHPPYLGVWASLLEDAGDALEGAAGAVPRDEVVELLAGEVGEDLGAGGGGVVRGVGLVVVRVSSEKQGSS